MSPAWLHEVCDDDDDGVLMDNQLILTEMEEAVLY